METEWNLLEAADFIKYHAIDNEDFLGADNDVQIKLLNVSKATLTRKFKGLIIPNNAVYLFAATIGALYNDTNKLAQQGVASFSISGISLTFKDWAKKSITDYITEDVTELISGANGGIHVSSGRSIKWVSM